MINLNCYQMPYQTETPFLETGRIPMDISAIFKAVLAPGQERGRDHFEGVRPGDQLTAKIVKIETDGRLLIDLGRFRALAQTNLQGDIQARPGQTLNLTVEKVGTPLQLRLTPEASAPTPKPLPEIGLTSLFTTKELHQALDAIRSVARFLQEPSDRSIGPGGTRSQLSPFDNETGEARAAFRSAGPSAAQPRPNGMTSGMRLTAPVQQALVHLGLFLAKPGSDASVRQWIDALRIHLSESGHLFEAKLAEMTDPAVSAADKFSGEALQKMITRDLKPNLLMLKETFAARDGQVLSETAVAPKDIDILRRTVDRLLFHVDQQQERAVQRAGDQDLYQMFAHLVPVKDQPQPVRLKVYYPRKHAGGQGDLNHRIALLLHMDRLGPIRADVAMDGKRLSVRFYVRDQAVRERFDRHVSDMETALSASFEQVDITTTISREKIDQFDEEDHRGASVGRIDLRA